MKPLISVNLVHRGFRWLYMAIVAAGLGWQALRANETGRDLDPADVALCAVGLGLALLTQIAGSRGRPSQRIELVTSMVADMTLLAALAHTVCESTVVVFVSMIWVMLRAALRFGSRYLLGGMALSIVGLGSAMGTCGVWHDYPHIGWGLLVGLVLMPTYIYRMVRTLMAARDRAFEADVAKSRFLANMSHEFRTPLNGILGMADLMSTIELPPEARHYLDGIRASATGLGKSVQELLDFASIEAGKVRVVPDDFSVAETVRSVLMAMESQVRAKGLDIHTHIAPNVPEIVHGGGEHARRALLSLVCNAVKFTHRGHIEIRVTWQQRGDDKAMLVFWVKDTGVGFSTEIGRRIFDPFEQADAGLSRTASGTGLGLNIAKGFAEANNGDIGFKSTPGLGSEFWVSFEVRPVSPSSPASAASAAATAPPTLLQPVPAAAPMRVLVVDDQPSNRLVFEPMLKKAGHQVIAVESGAAAIDQLSLEWADLMLIDLHMPGLNGVDVVSWVRARELSRALPAMPILVLTADGTDHARTVALAAGATGLVTKPISMADLLHQVNSLALRSHPDFVQAAASKMASGCFLRDLREAIGDERTFRNVVNQTIIDLERVLEKLGTALSLGGKAQAAEEAHAAKGLAENLGLELLASTAKTLETGLRSNSLLHGEMLRSHAEMQRLFREGTKIVRARFDLELEEA